MSAAAHIIFTAEGKTKIAFSFVKKVLKMFKAF